LEINLRISFLAQQATTVDIRPLFITVHENDLRKFVDFFAPDKSLPPPSPAILETGATLITTDTTHAGTHNPTTTNAILTTSNSSFPTTNNTKPSKTKVIVETLEVNLGTGSHETGNAVRLNARQLFFAAQPFKAGVIEGLIPSQFYFSFFFLY
jgi:hypothetical protein